MAVNAGVSLGRSYYGRRKVQKHTSFPKANGAQGIGLGVASCAITENNGGWFLRCCTGKRGSYIWLPLCVPAKWRERMDFIYGDAQLLERNGDWQVMLPLRIESDTPTVCDGEPRFIGVDRGIVRIATVSTPDGVALFDGKAMRHRREHVADLRKRYQRHNRLDA